MKKVVDSGLLGWPLKFTVSKHTGFDWKFYWVGKTDLTPQPVPLELDYESWLGPAPYKPYNVHRTHQTFRGYWDYDGGALGDMGQHYLDPIQYMLGKDNESPVYIEVDAPLQDKDAVGIFNRITYTYAGVKKSGLMWTAGLREMKQKVEAITGAKYNACLLNLYHEGEEGMGWHKDNEAEIVQGSSIASLSFGAARKFAFKHAKTNERLDIELANGSLLDMKGEVQQHWYHALPKTKKVKNRRINLTFRLMHGHSL